MTVKPLSEPFYSVLPNIDKAIPNALTAQGITRDGLLAVVFPNAEELFNTKWWSSFIEKYAGKSPIVEFFKFFNTQYAPPLQSILPGILAGKGKGR